MYIVFICGMEAGPHITEEGLSYDNVYRVYTWHGGGAANSLDQSLLPETNSAHLLKKFYVQYGSQMLITCAF
jgi:hypothetical protein